VSEGGDHENLIQAGSVALQWLEEFYNVLAVFLLVPSTVL
jgi:hypothetical protein